MIDLESASDATLVVAIGRWHEPALAEAYRRHGGAVYALARRVLGSSGSAEDVAQEVFLGLWQRPERFDANRGTLRGFLLAVTHSRAVDHLRSASARHAREVGELQKIAGGDYDLERHVWDLHLGERVREALRSLPDREREPIELAYFAGRTYREVATILGEPDGTIKGRIRSGLSKLRKALDAEGAFS